ncbi:hypothetical protein T459_13697 [Capsicum annuum]|uniref:Peptidase C1A papain C-terminal domain-containing protein n=1 Tax=Capsicum annuum TaxID=4072 RepID=A0A2G2ZFA9_CAPAN|nr:hypothetical protein T459_13697 [Capsicum annuum]
MSAVVSIKSKKAVVPLSKQHLTDCLFKYYPDTKKEAELKEGETYGCSCSKAYRFAVEQGIVEEESYPYAMRRSDCKCTETMKKVKIAGYKRINIRKLSKGQIEEHIKRQPITCSIRSYESLHAHVGQSVYMGPTVKEIEDRQASLARGEKDSTHSMLIVGFGTDEDGQDYYLVQNSWGERWGYHGYVGDMRLYYKPNPSNAMKSSHLSLDSVKGQAINEGLLTKFTLPPSEILNFPNLF